MKKSSRLTSVPTTYGTKRKLRQLQAVYRSGTLSNTVDIVVDVAMQSVSSHAAAPEKNERGGSQKAHADAPTKPVRGGTNTLGNASGGVRGGLGPSASPETFPGGRVDGWECPACHTIVAAELGDCPRCAADDREDQR